MTNITSSTDNHSQFFLTYFQVVKLIFEKSEIFSLFLIELLYMMPIRILKLSIFERGLLKFKVGLSKTLNPFVKKKKNTSINQVK